MPEPRAPDLPPVVPVEPDGLAMIVEYLEVMGTNHPVVEELRVAVADDAVELPADAVEEAISVLHDIDEGLGLHLGGVGRALSDALERALDAAEGPEQR